MAPLMYRDELDRAGVGDSYTNPEPQIEPQRAILVAASAGTISGRLLHALRREFPWTLVQQISGIEAACASFAVPVSLILLDAPLLRAAEDASPTLARLHPHALTAVIELDDHKPLCSLPEILGSQLVRGILPMNLGLDAWLSVIRLMLSGGEYYPPRMFRSFVEKAGNDGRNNAPPFASRPAYRGRDAELADLTAREVQILEMVSRGMQNKTIAAEFRLSEHTVKIHLHNIISKLGAHNRTEAAARYRNFQERAQAAASGNPPSST